MHKLLTTLKDKDTAAYYDLFPTFDTLWRMVMHNSDQSPETQKALANLKEHPQVLIEFDPLYNRSIVGGFANVLAKGEDSGVNWNNAVMARYELQISPPSRSLIGYEKVSPERFQGYMFITDKSTRVFHCIRVAEIQKIRNNFFGGQLLNILPAKTVDEYNLREQQEEAYFAWMAANPDSVAIKDSIAKADTTESIDTTTANDPLSISFEDDDETSLRRQIVVERKYYEGTLDNEIPMVLYIRYMKPIPGKPQQYDGLYKLGENKRYLRLEITRNSNGKWIIEDESAVGTMELLQDGRKFTGAWANADDNGYDVALAQTTAPPAKIELLDKIIDQGLSGRIDEEQFKKAAEKEEKERKERQEKEKEEREKEKRRKEKEARKQQKRDRRKKDSHKEENTPDGKDKQASKPASNKNDNAAKEE